MKFESKYQRSPLTADQIAIRKRFIGATVVTCIVASLVFGTIHVLQLGANRFEQMRNLAEIDLDKELDHVRAAGEDLYRTDAHEKRVTHQLSYTVTQAEALLTINQWKELDSMISIPGGETLIGTDDPKTNEFNRPAHKVNIPAFQIGKYLVTNAQYARFVAATHRRPPIFWTNGKIPPGFELHPVTMVSWHDAQAYAAWMNKRLPREVEWERAARGPQSFKWPWGNNMEPTRLNTYYNVGMTTPVQQYSQGVSAYGVFDMAGNVQQWTDDDFLPYKGTSADEGVFKVKRVDVPQDPSQRGKKVADFVETSMLYKVMRGGSWKSDAFSTASYHRNFSHPNFTSDFYGFRIAGDVK